MPHPASSGTGYLTVAAWIQLMGEAEAWKFMDALHQNMAVYTHSGSAPCVQAAKGERVAGISFDMRARAGEGGRARRSRSSRRPRASAGTWRRFAIVKGTKKADAAKKVADWAVTKAANELYSKYYAVVAHPGREERAEELSGRCRGAHGQGRLRRRWRTTARACWPSGRSATSRRRRRRTR